MRAKNYRFDDTLQVGDLVTNTYDNTIGEITKIVRRVAQDSKTNCDIHLRETYNNCNVGDEITPEVYVKRLRDKQGNACRKIKGAYHGSYLIRLGKSFFQDKRERLSEEMTRWAILEQYYLS